MDRDPSSPMWVIFTDSWAQSKYSLYTWIPTVLQNMKQWFPPEARELYKDIGLGGPVDPRPSNSDCKGCGDHIKVFLYFRSTTITGLGGPPEI